MILDNYCHAHPRTHDCPQETGSLCVSCILTKSKVTRNKWGRSCPRQNLQAIACKETTLLRVILPGFLFYFFPEQTKCCSCCCHRHQGSASAFLQLAVKQWKKTCWNIIIQPWYHPVTRNLSAPLVLVGLKSSTDAVVQFVCKTR